VDELANRISFLKLLEKILNISLQKNLAEFRKPSAFLPPVRRSSP
jgi:hypothetical protein